MCVNVKELLPEITARIRPESTLCPVLVISSFVFLISRKRVCGVASPHILYHSGFGPFSCLRLHRWEYDESYCEAVKKMPPYDAGPRLLDVIDTAVFDYLIGNADRHHYESFQDDGGASMLILLDNAKR